MTGIVHKVVDHLAVHPLVAAAPRHQPVLRPQQPRDAGGGGAQGPGPHTAAGQGEHMAAALQLQLPPGGVPVRGLAELPPDGDPRGEDALGGQARRQELR